MIALDNPTKIKKSPKKPLVQVPVATKTEDDDSEDLEESDAEEAGTDSLNEEMEEGQGASNDDQSSSGVEGDESGDNEDSNELNEVSDKSKANPGWADAMKKILNIKKPKRKKSIVLSKAKKLNEILAKPKEVPVPFELEGENGEIKKETIKVEEGVDQSDKTTEQKNHRRKESLGIRVKPSVLDRERERRLQKIATNGVVQLFNAVRQQQKEIEEKLVEAGPLERKREKALKNIDRRAFLDVLMGGTSNLAPDEKKEELKEEEENKDENDESNNKDKKVWSVLRDDFVMGAKLKDWNKQDTDEESSAPEEMDSD
ncbi:hypothetical protein TSAR_002583 [Trichomalopsis sarcophagae]|uniref:RRP15-like protein n=1 Tax=Trichomalopsis sarcophagae TaxID=543379 RepID=A0A232F3P5_9HYME|nr:hypothetical protein TSAR_002583 [Trichomalopsis sarcophagae]